jgi:hypothetical protein
MQVVKCSHTQFTNTMSTAYTIDMRRRKWADSGTQIVPIYTQCMSTHKMLILSHTEVTKYYVHRLHINSILALWHVQILYTNYKYYKWNRHLSLKYYSELKYLSDFVYMYVHY